METKAAQGGTFVSETNIIVPAVAAETFALNGNAEGDAAL